MRLFHLAVAAGVLALPLAARADLLGNSVNVTYAYPTSTTVYDNLGDYTVPSGGALAGIASFVINPDQIDVSSEAKQIFNASSFNGFEFTDLSTDPDITGVTIDAASSADMEGAGITFTSDEVFVNLEGLSVNASDTLVLDLSFAPAASVTPEPASIALLASGLLGVAGTMRRRFVRS